MSVLDTSQAWSILRLAWKLSRRRWERQSPILGGVAILVTVVGVGSSVAALALAFFLGTTFLPGTEPLGRLIVWDGVIGVFLILWIAGLLVQLQLGGESLVIEKLLHMPVSPLSAFLMNFVGAQMRVSLLISLGVMLGLSAASVVVLGAGQLILFPLTMAFAAMVMCITHQFQSWLARVFANKRRRGTVVAIAVLAFVILANLPALTDRFLPGANSGAGDPAQMERWAIIGNAALPVGWLALGAWGVGDGHLWLGVVAVFGMAAVAALSLRRSYRKTIAATVLGEPAGRSRRRQSEDKPHRSRVVPAATPASATNPPRTMALGRILEALGRHIPDHSRAVAGVAVRLWIRAPQGKMVLFSPVLLIMLYVLLFQNTIGGDWASQFAVLGMMGFMIMMAFNLFANLFGQDGNGFRAVVLAGVPARELLLGKNLALLPYAVIVGTAMMTILQWVHPLPASHVLGNVAQLFVLYLVGCMLGNSFSIRMPWAMSPTSMGMRNATAVSFLASFLILLLLFGFIAPLAIPIAVEKWLASGGRVVPVYLIFSVIELGIVWLFYRRFLNSKGRLLAKRMETVLERVTQPIE
ncbi:MAG: hypothetical protein F4Z28_18850 [Gammaproteobacteria bacterium]|nr:hypothetical protein [Gammaproteobacteria bacterium]